MQFFPVLIKLCPYVTFSTSPVCSKGSVMERQGVGGGGWGLITFHALSLKQISVLARRKNSTKVLWGKTIEKTGNPSKLRESLIFAALCYASERSRQHPTQTLKKKKKKSTREERGKKSSDSLSERFTAAFPPAPTTDVKKKIKKSLSITANCSICLAIHKTSHAW